MRINSRWTKTNTVRISDVWIVERGCNDTYAADEGSGFLYCTIGKFPGRGLGDAAGAGHYE